MKQVTKIYFKTYWAKRDRNGNPRAVVEIFSNPEKSVLFYYSYLSEYQAAEAILRRMLQGNQKFITYQNDVNPSFFIMRSHHFNYEKNADGLKKGKKYFVLQDLGQVEVTISELKDLEKMSDNKKYYETTCSEFLETIGLKQNNQLAFYGVK